MVTITSDVPTTIEVSCKICSKSLTAWAPTSIVEAEEIVNGAVCNSSNSALSNVTTLTNPFAQLSQVDRILTIDFVEPPETTDAESLGGASFESKLQGETFGTQE